MGTPVAQSKNDAAKDWANEHLNRLADEGKIKKETLYPEQISAKLDPYFDESL